ncbi:MAG TPA: tetratricopeptide repeat protein, partial [Bacteroidia bacterium]|nr:tetratricopeptide repeat protein [Bacteroidia bacterium]
MNFKEVRDTANAIISFQRATEIDNSYFEPHLQLALLFAAKKDKLALQYFNAALKLNEFNPDALYARGLYLQEQGKFDEAVKDYRTLLSVNKDDYRAHYNIGFINFLNKKYLKAIENFSQTIMIYPEYTQAYYMRGLCHEAEGKKQEALNNYDYALQLDSTYAKAIEGKKRVGK